MNKYEDCLTKGGELEQKIRNAVSRKCPSALISEITDGNSYYKSHDMKITISKDFYISITEHCQGNEINPRRFLIESFFKGKSLEIAGYLTSDIDKYIEKASKQVEEFISNYQFSIC